VLQLRDSSTWREKTWNGRLLGHFHCGEKWDLNCTSNSCVEAWGSKAATFTGGSWLVRSWGLWPQLISS
jgi:hypothetical protein